MGGGLRAIPWFGPQPETDRGETAGDQVLIESPGFYLDIDAVFGG
jgi:hypothetical protein